jgi:ATP-dependent exoDNAse (exonuclease V) alpha subunit
MVSERDLQARAYELCAGVCRPKRARGMLEQLERSGELVRLEGGMWSTRQLRDLEQQTADRAARRAGEIAAPVREESLQHAAAEVEQQIGGRLSAEQRSALQKITGHGGVSVLEGQAGTGKGVVIRASAAAWQREGHTVIGTAVAGATAERLAADANLKSALTTDSLLARIGHGRLRLDERTVVVMDEAGMADTRRLAKLTQATEKAKSKLLLVGDGAQLSPVGAGGLFDQIKQRAPTAQLTEIRRARHAWEREAWQQIREGKAQQALASYHAHQRLHISDTREEATREMIAAWDTTRRQTGEEQTVMLADASNHELDKINALAQQARERNGELGKHRVPLKDRPYALAAGDRIIFTQSHPQPDGRRVENGTIGTISHASKKGRLTIDTGGPNPRQVSVDTGQFQGIKLAYAQHVYKAQGLTTERALVLTGGWQTDRERAYVALTRARERTDIHIARTDLGEQGLDPGTIQRLGETIDQSNAQQASISRDEQPRQGQTLTKQRAEEPERSLSEIGRILVEQEEREQREQDRDLGYGIE